MCCWELYYIYTLLHVCTMYMVNFYLSLIAVDKQQTSIDDGGKQTGRKTRSGAQKQVTRSPRRQMNKKLATPTLDQCSISQKKCNSRSNLQRHLLTHTEEKLFKCKTCQHDFLRRRGDFNQHMLTHTGEKSHQCNVCLKSFSRLSNLQCHSLRATSFTRSHRRENSWVSLLSQEICIR